MSPFRMCKGMFPCLAKTGQELSESFTLMARYTMRRLCTSHFSIT